MDSKGGESRFVTAAGYKFNEWDTHGNNDKQHKEEYPCVGSAARKGTGPEAEIELDRAP